jgi:Ni,Fe-hydrogenase I small subunit
MQYDEKNISGYLIYRSIGCRDPYTADRLSQLGVETAASYCLTLTLPKRKCQENKIRSFK